MTKKQRKKEIDRIIEIFVSEGYTQTSLERTLDLKRGTLKSDDSHELYTLLKILKTFPWMIYVADSDYDEIESKKALCHAAIDPMFERFERLKAMLKK